MGGDRGGLQMGEEGGMATGEGLVERLAHLGSREDEDGLTAWAQRYPPRSAPDAPPCN